MTKVERVHCAVPVESVYSTDRFRLYKVKED